jgi:ribonuclease-3
LPSYHVVDEHGPSHARVYEVEVYVEGQPRGYGKAKSKKHAEQQAAAEALDVLRHDATDGVA